MMWQFSGFVCLLGHRNTAWMALIIVCYKTVGLPILYRPHKWRLSKNFGRISRDKSNNDNEKRPFRSNVRSSMKITHLFGLNVGGDNSEIQNSLATTNILKKYSFTNHTGRYSMKCDLFSCVLWCCVCRTFQFSIISWWCVPLVVVVSVQITMATFCRNNVENKIPPGLAFSRPKECAETKYKC